MRLADIISKIERRIPCVWAEEWDNTGLIVGDPDCGIVKIALALDVTENMVREAIANGCQLLVSHHPIIFNAMRNLIFESPGPWAIKQAIQSSVALYAIHTNWDSSGEGVNSCLAHALGLADIMPLVPPKCDNGAWGLGAVGDFTGEKNLYDCMMLVREQWQLSYCSAFGDESNPIRRVAVGGGACGDLWPDALRAGADVFITADMSYHHRNDALAMGLSLIIADHGEMERVSLAALKALIAEETRLEVVMLKEEHINRLSI